MGGGVPVKDLDHGQGICANWWHEQPYAGFTCLRVQRLGTAYVRHGESMIPIPDHYPYVLCPDCADYAARTGRIRFPEQSPVHVEAWVESNHVGAAAYRIPAREQAAIAAAKAVPVAPHVTATRTSLLVLTRLAAVWLVTWVRVRLDAAAQRVANSIRRQLAPPVTATVLDARPLELTAATLPDRSWETIPDREPVYATRSH